jgi:hypothetical protein
MGIDTRFKKREPVPAAVKIVISEPTASMIKLNIPRSATENNAAVIKSQLIDVSATGCAVDCPFLIPAGILLGLEIEAAPFLTGAGKDRTDPIKTDAKVTSCTMKAAGHYRLSLNFSGISKDDSSLIEDFINRKG